MNRALVDQIVNAVLYEGYILYPYRPSSKKNQVQRFTFGRVYPEAYSIAQEGREPCAMQSEFLVRNDSRDAVAKISVRFLHPLAREVRGVNSQWVRELRVDESLYQTWTEATEREVELPALSLNEAALLTHEFAFPKSRESAPIKNNAGQTCGGILRSQELLDGVVEIAVERIDETVSKIRVRIFNGTPVPAAELENQDAIMMRTFASTHTILHAEGGECISLLDPPAQYTDAAKACKNIGTWPVLVGDQKKGERDAMLSSPIILYDYPQIAPESAGDLFDGAEIDEILTLRIQTMTDAEKAEMRNVDAHARRILERTEALPMEHLLKMHGTMRGFDAGFGEDFFNPKAKLDRVTVRGVEFKNGDRVRIRPKKRADVMDMALDGKIAIIEAVEEDVEKQVHFALVLEDDPGRDLGFLRQPGHRFFFGADEIEPL